MNLLRQIRPSDPYHNIHAKNLRLHLLILIYHFATQFKHMIIMSVTHVPSYNSAGHARRRPVGINWLRGHCALIYGPSVEVELVAHTEALLSGKMKSFEIIYFITPSIVNFISTLVLYKAVCLIVWTLQFTVPKHKITMIYETFWFLTAFFSDVNRACNGEFPWIQRVPVSGIFLEFSLLNFYKT